MTCQECEIKLGMGEDAREHLAGCAECRGIARELRLNSVALLGMRAEVAKASGRTGGSGADEGVRPTCCCNGIRGGDCDGDFFEGAARGEGFLCRRCGLRVRRFWLRITLLNIEK